MTNKAAMGCSMLAWAQTVLEAQTNSKRPIFGAILDPPTYPNIGRH